MRFIRSSMAKLSAPGRGLWLFLWNRTQDRFKRMCLLASLHAQLTKCHVDDVAELKNINEEMDLMRDVRALRCPTLFAPMIWKTVLPIERIDLSRSDAYVERILKKSPCWLLYADHETRREDVRQLLAYCQYQRSRK